jgi:cytochrome c553
MRTERLLTAVILGLLLIAAIAVPSGFLPIGLFVSKTLQVSANLKVPPLDDPAMIRRGAVHYDIICAGCHASPVAPHRADHLRLTPPAPRLHLRRDGWLPEVLFLTVKHGVPNSAMPAWPAKGRDDEVWSMVAFLQVLPDLDAPNYAEFAGLSAGAGTGISGICARCHGAAGQGDATGAFPRLDIQSPEYLRSSLRAYRNGQRQSGFMAGVAGALNDTEIMQLSVQFAGTQTDQAPIRQPPGTADDGKARRLSACAACHGPQGVARPAFPSLSGQSADYLAAQLHLFAQDPFTRGGGPFVDLMRQAGHDLTEADILEAVEWYAQPSKPERAQ